MQYRRRRPRGRPGNGLAAHRASRGRRRSVTFASSVCPIATPESPCPSGILLHLLNPCRAHREGQTHVKSVSPCARTSPPNRPAARLQYRRPRRPAHMPTPIASMRAADLHLGVSHALLRHPVQISHETFERQGVAAIATRCPEHRPRGGRCHGLARPGNHVLVARCRPRRRTRGCRRPDLPACGPSRVIGVDVFDT